MTIEATSTRPTSPPTPIRLAPQSLVLRHHSRPSLRTQTRTRELSTRQCPSSSRRHLLSKLESPRPRASLDPVATWNRTLVAPGTVRECPPRTLKTLNRTWIMCTRQREERIYCALEKTESRRLSAPQIMMKKMLKQVWGVIKV